MSILESLLGFTIASGLVFFTLEMADLADTKVSDFIDTQSQYVKGLKSEKVTSADCN